MKYNNVDLVNNIFRVLICSSLILGLFTGVIMLFKDIKPMFSLKEGNTTIEKLSDVTVVTAYFDIGTFRKGRPGHYYSRIIYYKWAKIFRYLKNPLVVYTNSVAFKDHMINVRSLNSNFTKIYVMQKSSLWTFKNYNQINAIFSSNSYPKFHPGTTVAEYTCAQHAKYEVLEKAAKNKLFGTKYYMWLDIGYFRNRRENVHFYLQKPHAFNDSKIGMNLLLYKQNFKRHPHHIMKTIAFFVGGGLVFGMREKVIEFAKQFRRAVIYFLSKGLANTDQTVLYAMYTELGKRIISPEIDIHYYKSKKEQDWFFLGNSMVREVNISNS